MLYIKPITKLVVINLVAGLGFLQAVSQICPYSFILRGYGIDKLIQLRQVIFWILESANALNPTDIMTYANIHIAIPALLSCVEMVPICLVVVWAYPVSPYRASSSDSPNDPEEGREDQRVNKGGPFGIRAFMAMVNPWDTVKGTLIAALLLAMQKPHKSKIERG